MRFILTACGELEMGSDTMRNSDLGDRQSGESLSPRHNLDRAVRSQIRKEGLKIIAIGAGGLPLFYVPVVMRVYHTYSPCLEEGGA